MFHFGMEYCFAANEELWRNIFFLLLNKILVPKTPQKMRILDIEELNILLQSKTKITSYGWEDSLRPLYWKQFGDIQNIWKNLHSSRGRDGREHWPKWFIRGSYWVRGNYDMDPRKQRQSLSWTINWCNEVWMRIRMNRCIGVDRDKLRR